MTWDDDNNRSTRWTTKYNLDGTCEATAVDALVHVYTRSIPFPLSFPLFRPPPPLLLTPLHRKSPSSLYISALFPSPSHPPPLRTSLPLIGSSLFLSLSLSTLSHSLSLSLASLSLYIVSDFPSHFNVSPSFSCPDSILSLFLVSSFQFQFTLFPLAPSLSLLQSQYTSPLLWSVACFLIQLLLNRYIGNKWSFSTIFF